MRATLIITGDDMQVNLESESDTEKKILGAVLGGEKFTAVNGSNISLTRGGCLRSFENPLGIADRNTITPYAIALVRDREAKE